ncbi:hypothetical protein [uncultured Enterococcus sp.]|uniref:hypothetical protein n=1 Tax=uncultured Enterococcus sp. TaxID=167972 RepID=UPI002AA928C8|nr:hypothetical protein [uncultured Enterococcus sp.]
MPQIKTRNENWLDRSSRLYNDISSEITKLYNAQKEAQDAVDAVAAQGDIGSLSLPVTNAQVEELNEKRRTLVSFCNGVHYEISELIDNPFSVGVSETIQAAYELNPSDITVKTGTQFFFFDKNTSLTDLISSTITDDELKADFQEKAKNLDKDKLSDTLQEDIKEARFWKDEFIKAEDCRKVAEEVFTPEVRAGWDSMSAAERKEIIENYVDQLSKVLGDGSKIHDKVVYDADGYGYASNPSKFLFWWTGSRTVSINPEFVDDPQKNYSVDKVIDTLTHETRHIYQNEVRENPGKYNAPELVIDDWSAEYIQAKDDYRNYYQQSVEEDAKAFAALARPSTAKIKE